VPAASAASFADAATGNAINAATRASGTARPDRSRHRVNLNVTGVLLSTAGLTGEADAPDEHEPDAYANPTAQYTESGIF
jgi:hypothetical protein